jgi:hypothetical protein
VASKKKNPQTDTQTKFHAPEIPGNDALMNSINSIQAEIALILAAKNLMASVRETYWLIFDFQAPPI